MRIRITFLGSLQLQTLLGVGATRIGSELFGVARSSSEFLAPWLGAAWSSSGGLRSLFEL